MKPRNFLLLAFFLPSLGQPARADQTWDGGGGDANWSTAVNWGGNSLPDFLMPITFAGSTQTTANNDLAAGTVIGGITFANDTFPLTNAFTLTGNAITLAGDIVTAAIAGGAFNATITDVIEFDMTFNGTRTITANNSGDKTHNLTIHGNLAETGGSWGLVKAGGSRLTLTGNNTYTGTTAVANGVLVLGSATALSNQSHVNFAGTSIGGAILGLGAGNFTRSLGTGPGEVQWTGHGGFAAFDADRIVNLGGLGATVQWATGNFVPNARNLVFGYGNGTDSQDSTHTLDFQNPIDLNGDVRTITVNDGNGTSNARIDAVLSGGLLDTGGTGAFTKNGTGTLSLTVASTYTGQTRVDSGTLLLNHANALPGGTGVTGGTSNLRLAGGVIGLGVGDFFRGLGTGDDQVQWTTTGGFAGFGADRVVNLGGAGTAVTWGAGGFIPNGASFSLSNLSADASVDFQNPIDLGAVDRTLSVANGSGARDAELSGALGGTGGIVKTGDGTLYLSSTQSTFTGPVNNTANVLQIAKLADFGQDSSLGHGTAGVPILMSSQFRTGTLDYLGDGDSSNRTFQLGPSNATFANGGIILSNGTGALVLTAPALNDAIPGVTVARTLTLGGSNTNQNTVSGIIRNHDTTGLVNLVKNDAGTWVLEGDNPYTGTTTINGGTLVLGGSNATSAVTVNSGASLHVNDPGAIGGGTFDLNGSVSIDNSSGAAIVVSTANLVTLDGNILFGGGHDLSFANGTVAAGGSRTITLNGTNRTLTFGQISYNNNLTTTVDDNGTGNRLVLGGVILADANQSRTHTFAGTGRIDITGAILDGAGTGADHLTYTGTSVLHLHAANSYTGNTTVNTSGGTLRVGASSNLAPGNLTVTQGTAELGNAAQTVGILTFGSGTNTVQVAAATVTLSSGTTLTLTGNLTANDNLNGAASFLLGGFVDLNGARTWTVDDSAGVADDFTVSTVIQNSGTGTFVKAGGGRLVLSGGNTFDSAFTIDGIVRIENNTALGSAVGGTTVTSGDALELAGGITVAGETLNFNGTGLSNTGALRNVAGTNSWAGTIVLDGSARIQADGGTHLTVGAITAGGTSRNITFGGDGDFIAGGRIGSGGANPVSGLVKEGTGLLTLSSALNDYTGSTTVNNGTLRLAASGVIPNTSSVTVNLGVLDLDGFDETINALTLGASTTTVAGNAASVVSGTPGGILRLSSNVTYNAGSVGFENARALISANLDVNNGTRTFTVNDAPNAIDLEVTGIISDSGAAASGIVKEGQGALQLSGANSYDGTTTLRSGTLILGNDEVLPNTSLSLDQRLGLTSTLDLNGHEETIGALTLSSGSTTVANSVNRIVDTAGGGILRLGGNITYNTGAATFHNNTATISADLDLNGATRTFTINDSSNAADDTVVSGDIGNSSGTAGITKSGAGTLVLSGTNTYNGSTSIGAGVLRAGSNGALGGSGVTLNGTDATLELANGIVLANNLTVSDSGNNKRLALRNGATAGEFSGDILIQEGTAGNFDLVADTGGTFTISGDIGQSSGTRTIDKEGAGIVILSGTNTYLGATTINAGTLLVDGNSGGATGSVAVKSGATFGGTGIVGGTTTIEGGATISAGGAGNTSFNNLDFNGGLTVGDAGSATWLVDIVGTTGHDRIDVVGTLNLANALLSLNWSEVSFQQSFVLASYGTLVGRFSNADPTETGGPFLLNGGEWTIDYSNNLITLHAVPEPGVIAPLLLAFGAGWWRRRKAGRS